MLKKNFRTRLDTYYFYSKRSILANLLYNLDIYGVADNFGNINFKDNIDRLSIKNDWESVGFDIAAATRAFTQEAMNER